MNTGLSRGRAMNTPFNEGRQAAKEGRKLEDNPYRNLPQTKANTDNIFNWDEGFTSVGEVKTW